MPIPKTIYVETQLLYTVRVLCCPTEVRTTKTTVMMVMTVMTGNDDNNGIIALAIGFSRASRRFIAAAASRRACGRVARRPNTLRARVSGVARQPRPRKEGWRARGQWRRSAGRAARPRVSRTDTPRPTRSPRTAGGCRGGDRRGGWVIRTFLRDGQLLNYEGPSFDLEPTTPSYIRARHRNHHRRRRSRSRRRSGRRRLVHVSTVRRHLRHRHRRRARNVRLRYCSARTGHCFFSPPTTFFPAFFSFSPAVLSQAARHRDDTRACKHVKYKYK